MIVQRYAAGRLAARKTRESPACRIRAFAPFQFEVNEPSTMPALASVVFARIAEFARRPVAEQARLRAQLEAALAVSLVDINPANRIVLDAPDGIAVAVLGDPAGALDIAQRCLSATAAGVPVAIAVNHGAIRYAQEDDDRVGLIGDAIGTASAIAHFAGPSRLFVSKTFHEALEETTPGRAASLRPAELFRGSGSSAPHRGALTRGACAPEVLYRVARARERRGPRLSAAASAARWRHRLRR